MKLLRFGPRGAERPGILDRNGVIRDLGGVVEDIGPESLADGLMQRLKGIAVTSLPAIAPEVRIGAPISRVGNFIGVGLNYVDHAAELGQPLPKEPILFSKAPGCLSGPYDPVIIPRGAAKVDWEVELAVVIGKPAS